MRELNKTLVNLHWLTNTKHTDSFSVIPKRKSAKLSYSPFDVVSSVRGGFFKYSHIDKDSTKYEKHSQCVSPPEKTKNKLENLLFYSNYFINCFYKLTQIKVKLALLNRVPNPIGRA